MKVEYSVEDEIAIIEISPTPSEKIPLITRTGMEELYEALLRADRDERVQGVIITTKENFSGGADLRELMSLSRIDDAIKWLETYWKALNLIRTMGKPVLAAVKGVCVAGGHEIVMVCDFVIAAKSARFGQPEVRVGSTAIYAVLLLPIVIGERRARELLLSGRMVSAEEAYRLGLINEVVDDSDLMSRAKQYLKEVIEKASPQAFKIMKAGLRFWTDLAMLGMQLGRDVTAMVWLSEEFRERCSAFLEKRRPSKRRFIGVR
ncbi:MAG: enoyl-CoA hydratase/isomerase family protein [Candidatus Nezhaarchaeota archaeon]|nr:enoyl-CoA hydratase/isomerase family protein [Candidatus Nezhaarchaeota archaeon]MCX8142258.1 enoyl-CoA hydratase/isomerase family protein [Candidatus Nezhaarchaeota archaeon]MDW8050769.1 enoyl-CoA hydratase/isomerase family protein [Nitrososphaerota archaeon]